MSERIGDPLVDLSHELNFRFDGKNYIGYSGDTLASALLSNGVKLFGRSFKYHRPRGIISDGFEEPNALFEIGVGSEKSPNIRATEQEIFDGLQAQSQNRFPSLRYDLMSINDYLSPFLGAGFYYKTFMWPRAFWEKVYEPFIRRSAGLGKLSGEEDRAHYDRGFRFCDLLIIGSGLGGLSAALHAGRAGLDVIICEADFEMGGRLIREQSHIDGVAARAWRRDLIQQLSGFENVRIMKRSVVTGTFDGGIYAVHERVSDHLADRGHLPRQTFWRIRARRAILAGGATERPVAFPNNDRPGIMLAGSVRSYANRFGVIPGERVVIFTNNDDGWKTAYDLVELGVTPHLVIDSRDESDHDGPFDIIRGRKVVGTFGRIGLREIQLDDGQRIGCDILAVSGGWNPNLHLTSHKGAKPIWDEKIAAFVPEIGAVEGLWAIGGASGEFDDDRIRQDAEDAVSAISGKARKQRRTQNESENSYKISPLWAVKGKGRAWLDFQNDVTVKDVAQAYQENFRSVEHMKRYTTLGMATDQGKTSNVNAIGVMASLTASSIEDTGTTTFRPPYHPIPIASIGAGGVGKDFQPQRFTVSHEFGFERGAPVIEAGLWYRSSYFPQKGDKHWRESCDREVNFVRKFVGICDVSTLGKIEICGPDAATFLDFVYTNTMSTLKVGKVRYGLMSREDGMVMDDGTCARLSEDRFVITTTTAAAGEVMLHLEFVQQCLCAYLDVQMISITDARAQFAVAGPLSRALLEAAFSFDFSNDNLPFMGTIPVNISGVSARVYRISFSGELGYEISVPRAYGASLFEVLVERAEALGGGVYGMEALNVLRIEKGFITHNEIHGRVTASDIGLGEMVAKGKDSFGKVMASRPSLLERSREQLVGLKPVGAVQKLLAGSIAIEVGEDPIRPNVQGYLTSVCYSPTLEKMIGLGFVKNGHSRIGDKIRMVDLVRDFDTLCEICDPVFYDKDGERMRG